MFIGITVGGGVGWWIGSAGGMWMAFLAGTAGSIGGSTGPSDLNGTICRACQALREANLPPGNIAVSQP